LVSKFLCFMKVDTACCKIYDIRHTDNSFLLLICIAVFGVNNNETSREDVRVFRNVKLQLCFF
jgi:hypothetical protein